MSTENLEQAKSEYQAGKSAFERGLYREAVERLERACALVARNSGLGGEMQLWLVTAYEAAGQRPEARALCQQLKQHPSYETRQQSSRVLYILEAPELQRPAEWMTQIPDLSAVSESRVEDRRGAGLSRVKKKAPPEFEDLSQIDTRDNQFIWVALLVAGAIAGALLWLS